MSVQLIMLSWLSSNLENFIKGRIMENWEIGVVRVDMIRRLAKLCLGWSYVFGAAGEMCTPMIVDFIERILY